MFSKKGKAARFQLNDKEPIVGQKQERRRIRSSPKDFQKTRPVSSAKPKNPQRYAAGFVLGFKDCRIIKESHPDVNKDY